MFAEELERSIDIGSVVSIATLMVIFSALILLLTRQSASDAGCDRCGHRALFNAHLALFAASVGLQAGTQMPFWLAAGTVIAGSLYCLIFCFVAMMKCLQAEVRPMAWLGFGTAAIVLQGALAALTGEAALLFLTTSVLNGLLGVAMALLAARAARQRMPVARFMVAMPFAAIAAGYLGRLILLLAGGTPTALVFASTVIAYLLACGVLFCVISAVSLRAWRLNAELKWASHHDLLTGLRNRASLEDLQTGWEPPPRGRKVLCMSIDLDRFKEVNDTFGHAAGDAVLRAAANRMRRTDGIDPRMIFRTGGDEFLIVMQCPLETDSSAISEALLRALGEPVRYQGTALRTGASIGIFESRNPISFREMLRRCDLALYDSKSAGRAQVSSFRAELGSAYAAQLQTRRDFAEALDAGQITILFQPQFEAAGLGLSGCEVLARWQHPERGILLPQDFLPVAEDLGLLARMDRLVLGKALSAFRRWQEADLTVPRISVNISSARLNDARLISELQGRPLLGPGQLCFEVQETSVLQENGQVYWTIDALKSMGIDIAIDDFGSGHAALNSLAALVPDRVKIDRRMIAAMLQDDHRRMLVQAVIEIAARMGAKTTAEGVETPEQIETLRAMGCDELQGFALALPMTEDDMSGWLAARRSTARTGTD